MTRLPSNPHRKVGVSASWISPVISRRLLPLLAVLLGLVLAATSHPLFAEKPQVQTLQLAGVFGDNMVLQRETDAAIWGKATADTEISVTPSWNNRTARVTADSQGHWRTSLATPAAGGPYSIRVQSGDQTLTLSNVLVGEVWICSGQSNMQWKMRGFGPDEFKEDVAKANYPNIRFCDVPQNLAFKEQQDVQTKWSVCNPSTAYNFSAVAYFFGSRLHQELDVPIGLVSTNWGGAPLKHGQVKKRCKRNSQSLLKRWQVTRD